MAASSMPSSLQTTLEKPYYALVEYQTPLGNVYTDNWTQLRHSIVDRITLKVGPSPSEAVIQVPVNVILALGDNSLRSFNSDVTNNIFRDDLLSPFSSSAPDLEIYSQIRIFIGQNMKPWDVRAGTFPKTPAFVGFVTDFEYIAIGQTTTTCRIICKDVRELLRKTPFAGYIHYNDRKMNPATQTDATVPTETVYIRDRDLIFNEGMQPNMYFDQELTEKSDLFPRFIHTNYSRFFDAGLTVAEVGADDKMYIHDAWVEDPDKKDAINYPIAVKWKPGHIWNYIVISFHIR